MPNGIFFARNTELQRGKDRARNPSRIARGHAMSHFSLPATMMGFATITAATFVLLLHQSACGFTIKSPIIGRSLKSAPPLFASAAVEQAEALKAQATKMRLEAEKLDAELTLEKMNALEKKLNDKSWRERHPDQEADLRQKLLNLNNKLQGKPPTAKKTVVTPEKAPATSTTTEPKTETKETSIQSLEPPKKVDREPAGVQNENPMTGFDAQDLELFLPVARQIERDMPNATIDKQLETFRQTPELQQHFSDKIQALLIGPMEDLQKLENFKSQYLNSRSSVEKEQLKRQITQLEKILEKDSPFLFSNSVYRQVPTMSDEELQERVAAIEALPKLMQSLYKKRNDVRDEDDLRLAILVEHYEPQLQLFDQVRAIAPLNKESRQEAIAGFESLPIMVREHFLRNLGLPLDSDPETVVKELEGGASEMNLGFGKMIVEASKSVDLPEYSDIEFMDRSRFVEEFLPSFARMEKVRPTEEEIETFCSEVLDKSTYTLTSKPERVMGGYYLRGISRIEGDGAADKLVARLKEKLEQSSLKDDLQFFFIPDPTPLTDEEFESGERERPLLAVTSKDTNEFYSLARPQTKALVSSLGLISAFVFALGACGMNADMMDRVQQGLTSGSVDVSWFAGAFFTTFASMLGIQLVHEVAHRIVAWKDKFEIGFPNLIPSISLGLTGSITPFKSPPKNWNSMFDFAIAGPLAGIAASLFLLVNGLGITASMDIAAQSQLPAMPALLLHASALGGGLVETFLGGGVISNAAPETVMPLHPFAIAGFVGLLSNALALLPLGHTDGGRMALTLFGRRGFFLVKILSVLAICAAGLFGLDNSEILLSYALFVVIWQRELESPALNEVDDLSTARALAAFPIAVLVALSLIPLP